VATDLGRGGRFCSSFVLSSSLNAEVNELLNPSTFVKVVIKIKVQQVALLYSLQCIIWSMFYARFFALKLKGLLCKLHAGVC